MRLGRHAADRDLEIGQIGDREADPDPGADRKEDRAGGAAAETAGNDVHTGDRGQEIEAATDGDQPAGGQDREADRPAHLNCSG